jgi:hypothetical protein
VEPEGAAAAGRWARLAGVLDAGLFGAAPKCERPATRRLAFRVLRAALDRAPGVMDTAVADRLARLAPVDPECWYARQARLCRCRRCRCKVAAGIPRERI